MKRQGLLLGLGPNIVVLGVTSLLTDMSTEMIFPLFPLFTVGVLGATPAAFGFIEGLAECTASLLKVFSGWWSDRIGRRKPLIVGGYWLSTVAKPFLALASNWFHALGVRFTERVGKGMRTPPRDAMIVDSCTLDVRGKAFGLHRAMDTAGAILGPGLAFLLLLFIGIREVFVVASIPALLAVAILILFVHEVRRERAPRLPLRKGFGSLGPNFMRCLAVVTMFSFANISWGFLLLRARELGFGVEHIVLLYMLFNVVYALVSLPAGVLSDRVGRRPVIAAGYCSFGVMCLGLASVPGKLPALPCFALYGVYMGLVEGVQRAYVADLAPLKLRGTAMGIFHTATGLAILPASIIAGVLWQLVGSWGAFAFASSLSFASAVLMIVALGEKRPTSRNEESST